MLKRILSVTLAVLMAALFGCSAVPEANSGVQNASYINKAGKPAPIKVYTSGEAASTDYEYDRLLTEANNDFAIRMINASDKKMTGVFSPLSLQTALQMLVNGGDEETAKDLLDSVAPGMTKESVNKACAKLIAMLTATDGFTMNNAVIANSANEVNREFAETVGDYYKASVGALDFSNPQKATQQVNDWIAENTNGMIKNLLDELKPSTVMVLLNALTLKLDWKTPFTAIRETAEFNGSKGKEPVTMINVSSNFEYGSFDLGEMVLVPYKGGDYNMAVILPAEGVTPSDAAAALIERLNDCEPADVYLKMPKVDLNTKLDIIPMAYKLGIDSAINGLYTNLIANDSANVDTIVHGAALSVTEYGTMASAATAIVATKGAFSPADKNVICDRPYAMVIYHIETGTVLFVSIVNDIG